MEHPKSAGSFYWSHEYLAFEISHPIRKDFNGWVKLRTCWWKSPRITQGFILWETTGVCTIFQLGPKWWTNQPSHQATLINHAAGFKIKNTVISQNIKTTDKRLQSNFLLLGTPGHPQRFPVHILTAHIRSVLLMLWLMQRTEILKSTEKTSRAEEDHVVWQRQENMIWSQLISSRVTQQQQCLPDTLTATTLRLRFSAVLATTGKSLVCRLKAALSATLCSWSKRKHRVREKDSESRKNVFV